MQTSEVALDKFYALICYLVLASPFGGKHPDYLLEKMFVLDCGVAAFAALDHENMAIAIAYCSRWGVPVPAAWLREFELQARAAETLSHDPDCSCAECVEVGRLRAEDRTEQQAKEAQP